MKQTKTKKVIKWLSLIIGVFMIALTGCSSVSTPALDIVMPWSEKNKACGEQAVYEYSRYLTSATFDKTTATADDSEDKGYKLTQSGVLTYTLTEGKSIIFNKESGTIDDIEDIVDEPAHTVIKMEIITKYKDDLSHVPTEAVRNVYAGKTDTIITYTVIDRFTLASLFTYKITDIQAQAAADTMSYTLIADYSGEFTGEKKATVTDRLNTRKLTIKSGTYYDNESVYYRARAMSTLTAGGSATFSMAAPYDDTLVKAKKLKTKGVKQATAADTSKVTLNEFVHSIFDIPASTEADPVETYELDCYKTVLSLTSAKSGPSINLYYSAHPVLFNIKAGCFNTTSKVLVKIDYPYNDKLTNSIYQQEFVLQEYANW